MKEYKCEHLVDDYMGPPIVFYAGEDTSFLMCHTCFAINRADVVTGFIKEIVSEPIERGIRFGMPWR